MKRRKRKDARGKLEGAVREGGGGRAESGRGTGDDGGRRIRKDRRGKKTKGKWRRIHKRRRKLKKKDGW